MQASLYTGPAWSQTCALFIFILIKSLLRVCDISFKDTDSITFFPSTVNVAAEQICIPSFPVHPVKLLNNNFVSCNRKVHML